MTTDLYDEYHRKQLKKKVYPPLHLKFWNWVKSLYPKFWWRFLAPDNLKLKFEWGSYWIYGIDEHGNEGGKISAKILRTKEGRKYIKKFAERYK